MQIRTATENDQPAWDNYVLNHPKGLAYQLFAWKRAVKKAYGHDAHYLLAEDGSELCGILPLIDFRIPFFGSSLISLPYCDAGGVLADSPEIARELLKNTTSVAEESGSKCQIRSTVAIESELSNSINKVRMLLELPTDSKQLQAGLKAKLRSQVKKPIRDGLTANFGGAELLTQFYKVFSENMRDLGSPVHSFRWFEAVVAAYGEHCRVAVVYTTEGIPAAAGVVLLHKNTVCIPWASALRKYNRLNPNMLLYWTFLTFSADNGYRCFDFGRSTPGEGTYRFKEQWGAKPHPLHWYDYPSIEYSPDEQSTRPATVRQFVESIWQKIPLGLANSLGPRLRKYISL